MLKNIINFYRVSQPKPCNEGSLSEQKQRLKRLQWSTFLAATLGYGMYYVCRLSLNVVKKPIVDEGVFSETELGIIGAVLFFTYAVGKFMNGFLADRSNINRFMSTGLLVTALVNLCLGFVHSFILFAVLWGISGWFQSMGAASCVVGLSRWFTDKKRGSFYGFWSASHNIGEAMTFIIVASIVSALGWRYGFLGAGLVGLAPAQGGAAAGALSGSGDPAPPAIRIQRRILGTGATSGGPAAGKGTGRGRAAGAQTESAADPYPGGGGAFSEWGRSAAGPLNRGGASRGRLLLCFAPGVLQELLHLGGVGFLGVQQPLREISDLAVSTGVVPQMPGTFGGPHGVSLNDHLRDVGCRGVCQRFESGHDLCGHLGQKAWVPGLLSQRPEQALRLIRDLAVLGALLAQNPPQAVIPDLPVQAV